MYSTAYAHSDTPYIYQSRRIDKQRMFYLIDYNIPLHIIVVNL